MSQAPSAAAAAAAGPTATAAPDGYRFAAQLAEVEQAGCKVLAIDGRTVALFAADGQVHAIDNRCPHMGFPLDRGTVQDGILTCHWHHARFDLSTGGAFDGFADDVDRFPACVVDGAVWVDVSRHGDRRAHMRSRLREGLEQDIPLVMAKAAIHLLEAGGDPDRLIAVLGACLLREDRDFHTIQAVEAALRQFAHHLGKPTGAHILIAAARYLAAHAPTVRSQDQTYRIALRLHRGEALWA